MERSFDDRDTEALLSGGAVDPTLAPVAELLEALRHEVVRTVPRRIEDAHLDAMLAAGPKAPPVEVAAPRTRARRRHHGRRVAVFAACVGMTLGYGGLAAAGALPGLNAATQLGSWFHAREAPSHTTPATDAVVPGHSHGAGSVPPSAKPQRRVQGPGPTDPAPGDSASVSTGAAPDSNRPGSASGATAPGNRDATPATTAPGQTGATPAATAPGHTGTTPGATAPGRTGNTPGTTAPGHTGNTPGTTAPGHTKSATSTSAPHGDGNTNGGGANGSQSGTKNGEGTGHGA